jgi:hypothetical protein
MSLLVILVKKTSKVIAQLGYSCGFFDEAVKYHQM